MMLNSLHLFYSRSDVERDEWIASIRNLCRTNLHLSDKYHPTIAVSAARWLCCGDSTVVSRNSSLSGGCQPITWTPRQSKCDPVPPLPQDIRSSPRVVNNSSTSQLHSSKQHKKVRYYSCTGKLIKKSKLFRIPSPARASWHRHR